MNEENKKLLLEAGVDLDRTMERFMNNEGLYLKFLKRFPEDPNFAQMRKILQADSMRRLSRMLIH